MKKALVVGIGAYTTEKVLRGCVNDATKIQNLLQKYVSV